MSLNWLGLLLSEYQQLPLNLADSYSVLMVILRRKSVPLGYANFVAARYASINASIHRLGTRSIPRVVSRIIRVV